MRGRRQRNFKLVFQEFSRRPKLQTTNRNKKTNNKQNKSIYFVRSNFSALTFNYESFIWFYSKYSKNNAYHILFMWFVETIINYRIKRFYRLLPVTALNPCPTKATKIPNCPICIFCSFSVRIVWWNYYYCSIVALV